MSHNRLVLIFLCLNLLNCTIGCSSLIYLPAQKQPYTDPTKFKHKPEDVFFNSEDGVQLHGWYFKSPVRPAKATLLLFHGNAQNLTTHFFSLYWALDQGFDYFIFDYRGYGESAGEPTPKGTVEDGLAALKWISQHKDPATKLVLFGQSLGGAVALRVACDTAKRGLYDMVIVDSTFSSYRTIARKILSRVWFTWPFQWIGWLVMSDADAPGTCIGDISPHPILVINGTKDQTVDFELGQTVYARAKAPKEFWQVEGGRHTDVLFREHGRFQKRFADWIVHGPSAPEKIEILNPAPDDESNNDSHEDD